MVNKLSWECGIDLYPRELQYFFACIISKFDDGLSPTNAIDSLEEEELYVLVELFWKVNDYVVHANYCMFCCKNTNSIS